MAGLVIESVKSGASFGSPLKLVDLGASETVLSRSGRTTRVAWARWQGSRQLAVIESPVRLLVVEGQPDRLPGPDETLADWLAGRGGSFRGFEIVWGRGDSRPDRITAFVDPLGTRPIYFHASAERVWIADKLATIAVNQPGLECDWGGLLECAVVGSLYSPRTSIQNAVLLQPGEAVEVAGGAAAVRRGEKRQFDENAKPDPDAPRQLERALRTAIAETWTDPNGHLLLSGGLDSRLILGLAEPPRKAMTIDLFPKETTIARRVAEACGAELSVLPFDQSHYCGVLRHAYLVTGAMHQSCLVSQLGMGSQWRAAGVASIVHGYFHNTIFRGWTAERWRRYPEVASVLGSYMGSKAYYFETFDCFSRTSADGVVALLSGDGRQLMKRQLRDLAEGLDPVIVDGFDLTFERRLLREPARQVNFAAFLGWCEELDVQSPVFHRAVWQWHSASHPADRHRDRAVRSLYQRLGHGLADIPDFSTGAAVRMLPEDWREGVRDQFWYPAARSLWRGYRRLRGTPPAQPTGLPWQRIFRQGPIVDELRESIAALDGNPLIDFPAVEGALASYLRGDDRPLDPLWAVAVAGQWSRFVRERKPDSRWLRTIGDGGRAPKPASTGVLTSNLPSGANS